MKHNERYERFHAYVDKLPDFRANVRSWRFWRDCLALFFAASLLGHVLEYFWLWGLNLQEHWDLQAFPIIAEPYGIGVLVILLFVYPLVKRKKIDVVGTFVLGVVFTTVVEFLCALILTLFHGSNPYWDYSHNALNLFGFVCLQNSLAFGFVALVFVYFMFPWIHHKMAQANQKILNIVVVALVILYAASLTSQFLWMGRIIL
ncbi:MAG: putative ABC transporter permease [Candidatus Nomurabacteria bacterium]|jgi:uncharacterized membrane protein|nr:putative ABC transporter permease [Candidatus Nomurabacteria bacterium]